MFILFVRRISMKNKKWILVLSAIVCFVVAGVIIAVGVKNNTDNHIHDVAEAREYHIGGDKVYYTQYCGCGKYDEQTNIDLSVNEVFACATEQDSVVLDGDVSVGENIKLQGFSNDIVGGASSNCVINLDLRGHSFTSSASSTGALGGALFYLNTGSGTISLNIKNGKLDAGQLTYVLRLVNSMNGQNGRLDLNLNNVECCVNANSSATIFADESLNNGRVVANNCRFIATSPNENGSPNSFGVVINANSQFEFNGCYFEGGDSVYVRRGNVAINACSLVSNSVLSNEALTDSITSMGSCLVLDCNNDNGVKSVYNVTLRDSYLDALGKPNKKSMIIGRSGTDTGEISEHAENNCVLEIENCRFSTDVSKIPELNGIVTCNPGQEENNGRVKEWFKVN